MDENEQILVQEQVQTNVFTQNNYNITTVVTIKRTRVNKLAIITEVNKVTVIRLHITLNE